MARTRVSETAPKKPSWEVAKCPRQNLVEGRGHPQWPVGVTTRHLLVSKSIKKKRGEKLIPSHLVPFCAFGRISIQKRIPSTPARKTFRG